MNKFFINEGTINAPKSYDDQTVNIITDTSSPFKPNISITRDYKFLGQEYEAYVESQMANLKKEVAGFKLIDKKTFTWYGQKIPLHRFAWRAEGVTYYQIAVMYPMNDTLCIHVVITLINRPWAKKLLEEYEKIITSFQKHEHWEA